MQRGQRKYGKQIYQLAAAGLLLAAASGFATTHVIQFGGSFGLTYSPSNFSASVGDTVKWTGDFTMHPLKSTTIPGSAAAWTYTGTNTTFQYVITAAGTYNYECEVHVSLGMVGSFTVTTAVLPNRGLSGLKSANDIRFETINRSGTTDVTFAVPRGRIRDAAGFRPAGGRQDDPSRQDAACRQIRAAF